VRYGSNSDLIDPSVGQGCRAFLSLGHDEYWDARQFESVRALRDRPAAEGGGMSLCFLSGNSVCWVSPLTENLRTLGRRGRYGDLSHAGAKDSIEQFGPFPLVGNPDEGLLMGARNALTGIMGGGDWRCETPKHWLFAGTGMKRGETIAGLVGWEFHADPPTLAELPGLLVVGCGEAFGAFENPPVAQPWMATVYYPSAGSEEELLHEDEATSPTRSFCFNASTIFWSQGLSTPPGHVLPWSHFVRPHGPDPRVQRMTRNLLDRALAVQT